MIGQIFGNYKIDEKIGEGGMGAVFRGVDMMLEREVAIKFLRPELSSQPQVVERFRSEAVTLAKLNHPNVATLYNFMRQGDSFFMVLEFVRGVTLDNVIQQRGAIPCDQAIPLFCQVLDGIQHAHDFGIIHRDIKPANMMLTEKGMLKVLDFGIARILGTARMTRQGNIIGTIEYMSPEQVRGMDTDARSDIYSLGMLLYEMLTGRCPFDMQNEFELMKAQIEQMPVPPRQLNFAIPEAVEQTIWKAIAKNPSERFQSAGEFRTFLLNAGFTTTGRIEPLAVGDPNPYATRPLNTLSPLNTPPFGYPTTPTQPGYPTASGAAAPSQPGVSTPSQPGVSVPSHPGVTPPPASNPGTANADPMGATLVDGIAPRQGFDAASKETRVGTTGGYTGGAGAFDPLKATRVGTSPGVNAFPPPAGNAFAPPAGFAPTMPPPPQSFMSKLTWVHYAGAGVAALFVLVALAGLSFFVLSSRKAPAPVQPKALNEEPAKPSTQAGTQELAPAPQQPPPPQTVPAQGDASAQLPPDVGTASDVKTADKPVDITPVAPPAASSSVEGRQAASRPAQKSPAPARPRVDASDDARRKRAAALRALEQ
jgi:serine/threonine-protein kinase